MSDVNEEEIRDQGSTEGTGNSDEGTGIRH